LCFNDADDQSLPLRLAAQLNVALALRAELDDDFNDHFLIGARFTRLPPDATWHYSEFLNSLFGADLYLKQYRELVFIQSTWFMPTSLFRKVGQFHVGLAEDLDFFHRVMDLLPRVRLEVARPGEALVMYRHLAGSQCSKTPKTVLLEIRVRAFERRVLAGGWMDSGFYIWGAGRDGRLVFTMLGAEFRARVLGFFDVDANKIKQGFHHDLIRPVVLGIENPCLFDDASVLARKPFVVCVAMGRTNGELEANIARLRGSEGVDYWHLI
jgi:hypothetical protein